MIRTGTSRHRHRAVTSHAIARRHGVPYDESRRTPYGHRELYPRLLICAVLASVAVLPARADGPRSVGAAGVTVALPAGWHSTRPDQGAITNPVTRIVAASGPIAPRLTGRCHSQVADYTFPPAAVAIVVVEWTVPLGGMKLGSGPPRPRRFTAAGLPIRRPPTIECHDGPGGAAELAEHGRSLAVYVLLGPKAPRSLAVRARAVLDTLRVSSR
jgi:hypothetical protein